MYEDCGVYYDRDKFQQLGQFTDEQMKLIQLANCESFDRYLDTLKCLNETDCPIYSIVADWDCLHSDDDLYLLIIEESKILSKESM